MGNDKSEFGDAGTSRGSKAATRAPFTLADAGLQEVAGTTVADRPPSKGGSGPFYPSTHQERLQEFVNGFGRIGKTYDDAVHPDEARFTKFQDRMMNVYNFDRETFMDMANVGKQIADKKLAPEAVGKALADIFVKTMERQGVTGPIDLQSADWLNLQGAMSGMMLSARANFDKDPGKYSEQTTAMVDAMESELRAKKVPNLHAIIWGDNGEPGMASGPANMFENRDRHKFAQ